MGICITDRIPEIPLTSEPVVAIDFTQPGVASQNILECLELGYHCVVGTTGIDEEKIDLIKERAEKAQLGVLIAPNFAIGAVLMMRFARIAAKYMSTSEIIEQHHDRKIDAPSGTSLMTAQLISEVQRNSPKEKQKELLKLQGVRGGNLDGVNIHSLRLPGFLAHHTVIFGDEGQTLTLRHDSINRESFMPGVMLAIDEIHRMKGLFIGLENLMKWN
jgi:4-hydroxy-tetrahydrodipicolinate reductase